MYYTADINSIKRFTRAIRSKIDSTMSNSSATWDFYDQLEIADALSRVLMGAPGGNDHVRQRAAIIKFLMKAYADATTAVLPLYFKVTETAVGDADKRIKLAGARGWLRIANEVINGGIIIDNVSAWWTESWPGEPPAQGEHNDIVVTPLTGWAEGYVSIRPSDELLERYPASVRGLAQRHMPAAGASNESSVVVTEDGEFRTSSASAGYPTGQSLLDEARQKYREALRERMGRPFLAENEELKRKREEHRAKTKANFEAFVRNRSNDTEQHISKLPFVPHGLAASRRWGIEVESGGARGVATPGGGWEAKSDGSLRSAYEGYTEVQDFEPFDEEVTETVHWESCDNRLRHNPRVEVNDPDLGYIMVPREDYIDPRTCQACGNVTRIVRREPQTIHHSARSGDCKEFVSPILTSMHSQGLEALCEALSKNPQNSSAGVHVHVESNDLTKQQIATIVYGYDILEPILEASYRRERRDFCRRRESDLVLKAARDARGEGYDPRSGQRYSTLNTHSLSAHGTLEFRAMGPVYEYDYLVRWAMLCRDLVNSVAAGAQTKDFAKIKSWDDLTAFLAKFGKEYVRAAVYELTGETGEVAKLVKAGQPVTTEALNLDVTNFVNSFTVGAAGISDSLLAFSRSINRAYPTISELNGRVANFATASGSLASV